LDPGNCAAEQNACIIAVDRPGMGLSEYKRGRVPVASSMKRQYTHGRGDSGSRISRPKFTYGMGKTITMFPVRSVAMLPKPSPQLPGDILTK